MNIKIFNKISVGMLVVAFVLGFVGPITVSAAGPAPVNLLSMSTNNFVILSKTGITNTGSHTSVITGNIGASPITAAAMDNVFCSEIVGTIYGVNAAYTGSGATTCFAGNPGVPAVVPADANKTLVDNAVLDMGTAYADAAGRTLPTATELGAGNIGGMTLAPGLYKWSTDVTIPTNLTLSGGANDVWIFQIAGNLSIASAGSVPSGIKVVLTGGAQASNIFWQVGGVIGATLGTYSTFNGTILSAKQIIIQTGAVLNGRALAQTQVTLDANTVTLPGAASPATLRVIKEVINDNSGIATAPQFNLHVKLAGVDVSGSPAIGVVSPGRSYALSAGTYVVSEDVHSGYGATFSGDCNSSGSVTLASGDSKTCTITNNDGGSGSYYFVPTVPPLIDLVKVPNPLALPNGPGLVTYAYTLRNIGTVPVGNVTLVGDSCSPITRDSGDTNTFATLGVGETWIYHCATTLSTTHTNTVTATAWANGLSAIDVANATVVVGIPVVPPLIHVTKVPNYLTLFAGGGMVTYTEIVTNPGTVSLSNVRLSDDQCSPTTYVSGDANGNAKLDTTETWTYTCKTNLTRTTTNTVTAHGDANGLTAQDLAVATVVVAPTIVSTTVIPKLPNTGNSDTGSFPWNFAIISGVIALVSVSLFVGLKKRVI